MGVPVSIKCQKIHLFEKLMRDLLALTLINEGMETKFLLLFVVITLLVLSKILMAFNFI